MLNPIKISPCNVGWDQMSPEEKGRHCSLCSKTVVDFTQMKKEEIQLELKNYFAQGQSVCGHFLAKDVDEIVVEVPVQLFSKPMGFHRQFALAILIVMGTSLVSCTNVNGKREKLKEVIITENLRGMDENLVEMDTLKNDKDSLPVKLGEIAPFPEEKVPSPPEKLPNEPLTGVSIPLDERMTGGVAIVDPPIVGEFSAGNDSIRIKENCALPEESDSLLNPVPKIMGKIAVQMSERKSK